MHDCLKLRTKIDVVEHVRFVYDKNLNFTSYSYKKFENKGFHVGTC